MNEFNVSKTMTCKDVKVVKGSYLVIKIGSQFFSTSFTDLDGKDFKKGVLQRSNTRNIGVQSNLYITGSMTETNGHQKIDPIPFELNFYSDLDDLECGDNDG